MKERQVFITLGARGSKEQLWPNARPPVLLTVSAMPHNGEYVPVSALVTLLDSTVKLLKATEKGITGKRSRTKWVVKDIGMGPTEYQTAEMWACQNVPTSDAGISQIKGGYG